VARSGAGVLPSYTLDAREDGAIQKGVPWPAPRFVDNGDGTVKDNLTGLIWLKNAHAFGYRTWAQALADCAALAHGQAGLTDGSTAGQWRLPSIRELKSLICARYYDPTLSNAQGTGPWSDGNAFSPVQSFYYWSSTTSAANTAFAWLFAFNHGYTGADAKTTAYCLWPVRSALQQPGRDRCRAAE
jgi:hypothetical protein